MMGVPKDHYTSASPQHDVVIPSFALGRTEVTFDYYDRLTKVTYRELPEDNGWGRGQRQVINVS